MFTVVGTIALPLIGFLLKKADNDRTDIRDQLRHLDKCFDDLKASVLSETVKRSDLDKVRSEITNNIANARIDVNETLARMREAISNETHGLHERVFRLEDQRFGKYPS